MILKTFKSVESPMPVRSFIDVETSCFLNVQKNKSTHLCALVVLLKDASNDQFLLNIVANLRRKPSWRKKSVYTTLKIDSFGPHWPYMKLFDDLKISGQDKNLIPTQF
jgi:hypothetical protein